MWLVSWGKSRNICLKDFCLIDRKYQFPLRLERIVFLYSVNYSYCFKKKILCGGANPAPILSGQEEPPSIWEKIKGLWPFLPNPLKIQIRYSPSWNQFRGFRTKNNTYNDTLWKSEFLISLLNIKIRYVQFLSNPDHAEDP